MSNEKNLIPFTSDQDREEAQKNGKKGGVASGVARRKKRQLKELCNIILENKITDNKMIENIRNRFPELAIDDVNFGLMLLLKQYEKAKDGDAKAFEIIRDTAGQKPVEQQEIGFLNSERIEIKIDGDDIE